MAGFDAWCRFLPSCTIERTRAIPFHIPSGVSHLAPLWAAGSNREQVWALVAILRAFGSVYWRAFGTSRRRSMRRRISSVRKREFFAAVRSQTASILDHVCSPPHPRRTELLETFRAIKTPPSDFAEADQLSVTSLEGRVNGPHPASAHRRCGHGS